jgi:hypothetical protein
MGSNLANEATTSPCEIAFSSVIENIAQNINEQSLIKKEKGTGTQPTKHNVIAEPKSTVASAEPHDTEHFNVVTAQFEHPHVQTHVKDDVASETANKVHTSVPNLNTPHDYIPTPILKAVSRYPSKVPTTHMIWNLNSHDAYDRSKNIITPDDWYNFQANHVAKTEQEYAGTNFARIMAEIGKSGNQN